jgi:hypothetical protein
MPPSEASAGKMEKKSGKSGKVTDVHKTNLKKKKQKKEKVPGSKIEKQSLNLLPEKNEHKSGKVSRKKISSVPSAVSGKVSEIVNPLILNYWNGRGLMEVPRMMLGELIDSTRYHQMCLMFLPSRRGKVSWRWVYRRAAFAPSLWRLARRKSRTISIDFHFRGRLDRSK